MIATLAVLPSAALAQAPAPERIADSLRADPTGVEVRQRIREAIRLSGLTPEQVRARLYAAGFAPTLLDQFLELHTVGRVRPVTDEGLVALKELGLITEQELKYFRRRPAQADSIAFARADSLERFGPGSGSDSAAAAAAPDSLPRRPVAQRQQTVPEQSRTPDASDDAGYEVFGLDVFRSGSTAFDPVLGGPVDADYRLGPGDQLSLILTGDVEEVHSLEVSREGFVVIPRVGQLYVANLTLGQLEDLMYTRLGRVYSGVRRGESATTRFSVGVGRLRASQVFVVGDVERPGSYMVSSAATAMTALYAAGGPTETGSLRRVDVRRKGAVIASLDVYDYLLRGDATRDVRLETGDIIFVPPASRRVRVSGAVTRPGTYELVPGETLQDLLRSAGGLRPDALRNRVQIERILAVGDSAAPGGSRTTIDIAGIGLGDDRAAAPVALQPGDVVRVFRISDRVRNTVTVKGHVWTEGPVGLSPGMRISDAVRRAGVKPGFFLGQVLLSRLQPDSSRVQLRAVFRDTLGNVENDLALQEDDLIEVFSAITADRQRYVSIGGAVRRPGRYPFREGMTLRDLVLMASGLQESASLDAAEIARLTFSGPGSAVTQAVRVPLDSSYRMEEGSDPAVVLASSRNYELKAYDDVLIHRQPNWELQRIVTIEGEVAYPGQYALLRRDERLADVISRAGGFTAEAYPEGGVLDRRKDRVGRVAVDFPTAVRRKGSPDNMILVEGDRIVVPPRSFTVTVQGEVNAPNVVAYSAGKGLAYYIDQAGGPTRTGDGRRAYVTQPNGKRQTTGWGRDPKPLAGSVIVVPRAGPPRNYLQTVSSFLTTIAGIISTAVLIDAATR